MPEVRRVGGACAASAEVAHRAGPGKYPSTPLANTMCGIIPLVHCADSRVSSSTTARSTLSGANPIATNAASQLHMCGYSNGAAVVITPRSLPRSRYAARAASCVGAKLWSDIRSMMRRVGRARRSIGWRHADRDDHRGVARPRIGHRRRAGAHPHAVSRGPPVGPARRGCRAVWRHHVARRFRRSRRHPGGGGADRRARRVDPQCGGGVSGPRRGVDGRGMAIHSSGECCWRGCPYVVPAARAARRRRPCGVRQLHLRHHRLARPGVVFSEQVRAAGIRGFAAQRRAVAAGDVGASRPDRHRHAASSWSPTRAASTTNRLSCGRKPSRRRSPRWWPRRRTSRSTRSSSAPAPGDSCTFRER